MAGSSFRSHSKDNPKRRDQYRSQTSRIKKKEIQTIVKIVLYKNGLDLALHIHNFRLALSNFTVKGPEKVVVILSRRGSVRHTKKSPFLNLSFFGAIPPGNDNS